MSEQKQQKALCPFKRIVEREYSGRKGTATMRERFDVCAGERCMAYHHGQCRRLEAGK